MHSSTRCVIFFTASLIAGVLGIPVDAWSDPPEPLAAAQPGRPGDPQRQVAVGQLRRQSQTPGGPSRYVLVDASGKISCYLLPTAGINLAPYLGRQIAVTGGALTHRRGSAPSIFVKEIKPLEQDQAEANPNEAPAVEAVQAGYVEDVGGDAIATDPTSENPAMAEPIPGEPIPGEPMPGQAIVGEPILGDVEVGGPAGTLSPIPDGVPYVLPPQSRSNTCSPGGVPQWSWIRTEYLLWWLDGMEVPPLVTTSPTGTPRADAGVLGTDGTEVLLGNEAILEDSRSGVRFTLGSLVAPGAVLGFEADYLGLEEDAWQFLAESNALGSPILARPFFNINPTDDATGEPNPPARQDAELVSLPDLVAGGVAVTAENSLHSAGIRLRRNLSCRQADCTDCCTVGRLASVDLLLGYRYMRLKERLTISEDPASLDPADRIQFQITDVFQTRNEFHGAEIGTIWEGSRHRWTWEFLAKMALGNVHQMVDIDGSTVIASPTDAGTTFSGGLLAQRSNMGHYSRDELAVVPELGATLGYLLTARLRATVGYTFLYISQVARPGDQIDLDLNPGLLPPEAEPFTGPLRPEFVLRDSDFWAQGLRLGLDYRW